MHPLLSDTKRVIEPEIASPIQTLQSHIEPLRARLAAHPIYRSIRTPDHLRLFMQTHVFAVWDFMSLLKSLQTRLTCTSVPWTPTAFPHSRRFINEIVLGEESDLYGDRPISHFEFYLEAMDDFHADTRPIRALLASSACSGQASLHAFRTPTDAPAEARAFLDTTFNVIRSGSLPAIAAAFTFGREDAIPTIFRSLVEQMSRHTESGNLNKFVWYLERHIEVDGDEHGPLSLRMMDDLCSPGGTPSEHLWQQATIAAEAALAARLALWDGIYARLSQ